VSPVIEDWFMKRLFRLFSVLVCPALLLLAAIPFAAAQNAAGPAAESRTSPASYDAVGARLIAWSEFQQPKPVSEKTEAAEAADSKSDQSAGQAGKTSSTPKQNQSLEIIEIIPQAPTAHSSSTNRVDPGGR
jgi:hypothetical protein